MVREWTSKVRVETNYGQRHLQGVLQKRRSQVKRPLVFRSRSELISRLCRILHELAPAFLSSSTFVHSSCSSLSCTPLFCWLSPTQTPTYGRVCDSDTERECFCSLLVYALVLLMSHAQTSLCHRCTPHIPEITHSCQIQVLGILYQTSVHPQLSNADPWSGHIVFWDNDRLFTFTTKSRVVLIPVSTQGCHLRAAGGPDA